MRQIIFLGLSGITLLSCNEKQQQHEKAPAGKYTTIEITKENSTATVELPKYTLISNSKNDRRADADEILRIKRKWPLAMQSKSKPPLTPY